MVCLEMMQVFIMCPIFYLMIKNSSQNETLRYQSTEPCRLDVSAILQQALDQSPAYGSIRNVLESLNSEEVSREIFKETMMSIVSS